MLGQKVVFFSVWLTWKFTVFSRRWAEWLCRNVLANNAWGPGFESSRCTKEYVWWWAVQLDLVHTYQLLFHTWVLVCVRPFDLYILSYSIVVYLALVNSSFLPLLTCMLAYVWFLLIACISVVLFCAVLRGSLLLVADCHCCSMSTISM